jgi:hypothetical protein
VSVSCYAGYTGEQEPRSFSLAGVRHEIVAIAKRWREPDADYFEVRTSDGLVGRLCRDRRDGTWTLLGR